MKAGPKQTLRITWIVFAVLELGLFVLAGWIFVANDRAIAENLAKARSVRDLELKLISYDKTKKENDELGNQGDRLAGRFTTEETAVDFLREIETAALDSGVSLKISLYEIKPAATSKKEKEKAKKEEKKEDKPLVFLLETKSDFSSLAQFLVRLENMPKYAEIKKVDVAHETQKEQSQRQTEQGAEQVTVTKEFARGKIVIVAK